MEGQARLSGAFGPTEPASLPTEFQVLYKKKKKKPSPPPKKTSIGSRPLPAGRFTWTIAEKKIEHEDRPIREKRQLPRENQSPDLHPSGETVLANLCRRSEFITPAILTIKLRKRKRGCCPLVSQGRHDCLSIGSLRSRHGRVMIVEER